jgi:predicted ATPase/class 3 adenylate cyclase/DNA-binding CsgD family transcriptional regulator
MFAAAGRVMLATMTGIDLRGCVPPLNGSDLTSNELPTGTVTLLLADVEGSTRLWESHAEEMAAAFSRLDDALGDLLDACGGSRPVEQGEGDSFVLAFTRASQAIACALELQRAPLSPIRLRIGVHTGEVQLRDEGNYMGSTINRAARLRDLAHGGQTVLSGTTEDLVFDALPTDAWLIDLGAHELRGVARPERVAQLCHPDVGNEFPPLRTERSSAAQRLPLQLTSFVGRHAEIGDVRETLRAHRLVTLTGAGGAGKTRLAIEVAGQIATEFRDGTWYVDLAPITDAELVPVAMAGALGLADQPSRSTTELLTRVIGEHRMLVVLDNCEHLLDAAASLTSALLRACPGLTLLATSREPIGVTGEVTWQVPSLSLDDEAIELFVDRARRVQAGFTVAGGNIGAVREICRRLDGMPLAIELAAARMRALSLDEIVTSLHDRFRLLTGGGRTAVRRQQTLRASVDWSHRLLTEPERVLFRRLAVFLGGFDLPAARAVAGATEAERYQVLDQLTLLVDKSLVLADNTGGRTRYRLLETMRQYASEKLGESDEAHVVRSRHRDYFTATALLLDAAAVTDHQRRVEHAEVEIDNLRAAFVWSRENSDVEMALQIASALQPLWLTRGHLREGLGWIDAVLADLDSGEQDVAPVVLARALADAALLDGWVGVPQRKEQATYALTIARQIDDPALLVRALTACCSTAAFEAEQAAAYFGEAIELARALGDKWRLSQLLGFQAYAAMMAGDATAARTAGEEGRELAEAIGDRFAAGVCRVWGIGGARAVLGDFAGGAAALDELIADADAAGDTFCKFNGLQSVSFVLGWQGKTAAALAAAEAAIETGAELGEFHEALGYLTLGAAHLAAGDAVAAKSALAQGWSRIIDTEFSTLNTRWRAEAELAAGDLAAAWSWADQAVSATTGYFRTMSLVTRARVGLADDNAQAAERDAYEALASAAATTVQLALPDIFDCLTCLATRAQSHTEAARLGGAAATIRQRTGEVRYQIHQAIYDTTLVALQEALGHDDFDAAWTDGAALSTEEAIAYAQRGRGKRRRPSTGWDSLTPTERDVVRLLSEGLSNKDIALRLFSSPRTVETHLTHIYTKLGLSSRVQLAQEATRRSQ